jgi:hypothetical protein
VATDRGLLHQTWWQFMVAVHTGNEKAIAEFDLLLQESDLAGS